MSLTHPQTPIRIKPSRAQAASEKIQKHSEVQKLYKNQASKPLRTSRTSTLKLKNIQSRIIQTICLDLKGYWNQAQKSLETSTNRKSTKLYGFKPLKALKNFHHKPSKKKNTRRTHEEREEHEEQRISNKLIAKDSL